LIYVNKPSGGKVVTSNQLPTPTLQQGARNNSLTFE